MYCNVYINGGEGEPAEVNLNPIFTDNLYFYNTKPLIFINMG